MGFPAPFRREGLARRSWPLALALVIAFAAVPITPGQARLGPLAVAALLSAVAGLAALLSPWDRLPVWASAAPPIAVIVAIALLRHAEGGAESVYAALFVLPVLWLALYGTARQVIFALGVVGVMFLAPLVFLGEPDYPTSDWSRGLFIVLVCASVGLAVQRLVVSLQSREGETRMIIDRAHDAFVSIDIHGRITDWNSQAERTFGWPAGDAIGASLIDTVIPPVDRDEYWRGLGRFTATGECRLIDDRGETTAVRRDGSEVPVEVSVIAVPDGTLSCLHLFFRDLTRRKRAARHDAVQHGVAAVLAESVTLDDAIPSVLETVASGLGWEIATYWAPEGDTDLLVARHVWHDGSPAAARFASATRPLVLTTGAELPGIAWETRSPAWVEDVTTESDAVTARHAIAGEVGLHGAVALPMAVDEGAQGVVEFISHDVRRPDDELIKVMDTVTIQLGQFIERVRRTEELHHVEEVSRTDTLTGLPNRRGWDRELPRELARGARGAAGLRRAARHRRLQGLQRRAGTPRRRPRPARSGGGLAHRAAGHGRDRSLRRRRVRGDLPRLSSPHGTRPHPPARRRHATAADRLGRRRAVGWLRVARGAAYPDRRRALRREVRRAQLRGDRPAGSCRPDGRDPGAGRTHADRRGRIAVGRAGGSMFPA